MKIVELMHLLGEALDTHGNIEVLFEYTPQDPDCPCGDARCEPPDFGEWWGVEIKTVGIEQPDPDRDIKAKSVILASD